MAFQIQIAGVNQRGRTVNFTEAVSSYIKRLEPHASIALLSFENETVLLSEIGRPKSRVAPLLVLLDSRGKTFSSEAFAEWLRRERDGGRQSVAFAIGPASGWSAEARAKADMLLSMGPMTLPHELARLVLVEQVYRAFTILAGHPYHTGH